MTEIVGPPATAIRNRPITAELRALLDGAAAATGIQKIIIVSGGQTDNHAPHLKDKVGGWTGSRRHDNGRAADIELIKDGVKLSFSDGNGSQVAPFVTAAAARGAIGIGAAVGYMGQHRIHVGFGTSTSDFEKVVWGVKGVPAPSWLGLAAAAGWNGPTMSMMAMAMTAAGPTGRAPAASVVKARPGLWLRRGPGLAFDRARLLEAGTVLTVLGFDGEWARVGLEDDGLIDGHVHAAYLAAADPSDSDEGEEEPFTMNGPDFGAGDAAGGPGPRPAPAVPRRAARRRRTG